MFSECLHSLADTVNQLILAYGIQKSIQVSVVLHVGARPLEYFFRITLYPQQADGDHPYGYSNMRYVASLISGVGIFCVGAGLSVYHGLTGLFNPDPIASFYWVGASFSAHIHLFPFLLLIG